MKFLIKLSLFFAVILASLYFSFNYFLSKTTQKLLPYAKGIAADQGLEIEDLKISSASLSSIRTLSWHEIYAKFKIKKINNIKPDTDFELHLDKFSISIIDTAKGIFNLSAEGVELSSKEQISTNIKSPAIVIENAIYPLQIGAINIDLLKDPRSLVRNIYYQAEKLILALKNGQSTEELLFEGQLKLYYKEDLKEVAIKTDQNSKNIALDKTQLKTLLDSMELSYSDAELLLISNYPIRLPKLISIKIKAEKNSDIEYNNQDSRKVKVRDAYKYLLWSYLLTKEYGSDFSKKVTDAHEDVSEQSAAERNMDIKNASLGREYQIKGLTENKLKEMVLSDPRVVLNY